MERFTILLAVPSPLYAPLYLAKVRRYTCFDRIDFDYAGAPVGNADPLLDRVLAVAGKRRTIMSVGDPMRIVSTSPMDNQDTPVVVGGLITRMCYWALDNDTRVARHEAYWDKIRRIVAHPIGMTAYAVLFHDMFTRKAFDVEPDDVATYGRIDEYIIDDVDPGFERKAYQRLQSQSRKNGKNYGFLSTDPADYLHATASGDKTIRSFFQDDAYGDLVMTGLITGSELWDKQKGIIDAIREGVVTAVRDIREQPEYAAYLLQNYHDQRFGVAARYSEELLTDSITVLANAYSNDLKITSDQVRKSKEVWEPAEKLLRDRLAPPEREQREKRFAELEAFFHLDDPAQPSGHSANYSVIRDLLADRSVKKIGDVRGRRVLRYVVSPLLLLIGLILSTPNWEQGIIHGSWESQRHLIGRAALGLRLLVAALACLGGGMQVSDVARAYIDGVRLSLARLTLSSLFLLWAIFLFVGAVFPHEIKTEVTGSALVGMLVAMFVYLWRTGALSRVAFLFQAKKEILRARKQIRDILSTERARGEHSPSTGAPQRPPEHAPPPRPPAGEDKSDVL